MQALRNQKNTIITIINLKPSVNNNHDKAAPNNSVSK